MAETVLLPAAIVLISLSTSIIHLESKDTMSHDYPVFETDSCPVNKTEWNKRSSALNCTKHKGYICLPNESITSLLEFCYIKPKLTITKDTCLYLDKSSSKVNDYKCTTFSHGCPTGVYQSDDIYKYPGCTLIGHGCFLAEPSCKRNVQTSHRSESLTTTLFVPNGITSFKNVNAMEQSRLWLLFTLPVVAMVFLFSAAVFFYCHMRYRYIAKGFYKIVQPLSDEEPEDDNDISESEDQCKSPLSEDFGLPSQAQRKDVKGNFGLLSKACLHGDFETVENLLKDGAAVNVKEQGFSVTGDTPILSNFC